MIEPAFIDNITLPMGWKVYGEQAAVLNIGPFNAGFVQYHDRDRKHVGWVWYSSIAEIGCSKPKILSTQAGAQRELERLTVAFLTRQPESA